jgi:hypothetical protein
MRSSFAGAAVAASVFCIIVAKSPQLATDPFRRGATPATQGNQPDERRAYRHAVVKNGVYSSREAQSAVRSDAVVRAHYSDIQAPKLRPISSPGKPMFVSYRRGDRVYWTSHRVRVPEGESLLTDGTNIIRARCGNRLAEIPQEPVEARDQQPSEGELAQIEEIATTLPMAPMSIPSPLDPPSGGYAGQTSNTAAPTTAAQQRGATGAVARSWSPFMNGVSGLVVPKATVPSGTSESFVASEITYPNTPTPVTGKPSEQAPRGFGTESSGNGRDPSVDASAPGQRPDPVAGGAGSGPFSKSETVGYLVIVGPQEAGATASAWYEGPPPTSGGEGPDGVGALALTRVDRVDEKTTSEPLVHTPEPSSLVLFAPALVAIWGLRRRATRRPRLLV